MSASKQIIHWHEYEIELASTSNAFNLQQRTGINMVHIELRTLQPAKAPLPVTQTGYRSHFVDAEIVAEYENVAAYVTAWLDHEAKSSDWQKIETEARQYALL